MYILKKNIIFMKIKKNTKINLNISDDDENLNDYIYCWDKFGERPSKITIFSSFSKNEFNTIINEYSSQVKSSIELIPTDEFDIINDKKISKINDNIYLSYIILDRENDNSFIHEITFFYISEDDMKIINEILIKLNNSIIEIEEDVNNYKLNTVYISQNGIEIEAIDKIGLDDNIDLFYNEKTLKSVNKLIKTLKKSDKGLSVLYGERGTGKTSLINYISEKLDRIVIYIPNNMIDLTLNTPEFRTFLKKHHKPIIVLDDCEMIFNDLFSKSNIYVNNILQMLDGLLSDSIQLNIITIFNVEEESEIDHILLEANSFIDIIEVEYLDMDDANDLSKHLGFNKKYKTETKLIDVIKKNNIKNYKKIGLE
jgi:predicted AAA+ superfamily ATPase